MYNKITALVALILILVLVNWNILGKEKHLAEGKIVYLELEPVDPRSLMQGDYMFLRFQLIEEVRKALLGDNQYEWLTKDVVGNASHVVVSLDEQNVGSFKDIYTDQPLSNDELLLRFRVRDGAVVFATTAFFFQEGHAQYYQSARYGQFRVDTKGELLLTGMYDKDLKKLGLEEKNQPADR